MKTQREGIALLVTLLVLMAVAAIAAAAGMLTVNNQLITGAAERNDLLESAADAGLELGRARLNGEDVLPQTGYATLEDEVGMTDASGRAIPNVTRSVYAGPRGNTTGQFGVFASVVSVAEGPRGEQVIRRADILQESFAQFAYFTNTEPSNIAFGGGDQLFGPVHSNDDIRIYSSGATFHGPVRTAGSISGDRYGTFKQGYEEDVAVIPMPTTADLNELQGLAAGAGMNFTATGGGNGEASLRIEFVALDVNNDGDRTDPNEGFLRAYRSNDTRWVVAGVPWTGLRNSPNCGHVHVATDSFVAVTDHPNNGPDSKTAALSNAGKRCYLGGDPELWSGTFQPTDPYGSWVPYPGTVAPELTARFGTMANYLFPLARVYNPEFKGVVHVTGHVAVSGVVRGRVTLAATGEIIIADDLVYATDPSAPGRETTCDDMLGLFAGDDVIVADNSLNAPVQPGPGNNWFTYDDTPSEFINGTVLTLNQFTVENYANGSTRTEACEGQLWGRGCLYLTGGIIQERRGPVGTTAGTGYLKRYAYDGCAAKMPPPYYPTTGHYTRDRYVSVDPVGFDVADYFELLAPGG